MHEVQPGEVIVTDMTDPDWEPKKKLPPLSPTVGPLCYAVIISRELGIPLPLAVIMTDLIRKPVTVSRAEGQTGNIYEGHIL